MVGKLIAARLTIHLNGAPFSVGNGEVRGTTFGSQNWSLRTDFGRC